LIGFTPNFFGIEIDPFQSESNLKLAQGATKMTELTLLMAGTALLGHE
jgi:hypothetical protein